MTPNLRKTKQQSGVEKQSLKKIKNIITIGRLGVEIVSPKRSIF
jgi:hypothetical protein